jgi:hypothetical protein
MSFDIDHRIWLDLKFTTKTRMSGSLSLNGKWPKEDTGKVRLENADL